MKITRTEEESMKVQKARLHFHLAVGLTCLLSGLGLLLGAAPLAAQNSVVVLGDRKSTRLNSSHGYISYAVFCLKKKNKYKSSITSCSWQHSSGTPRPPPRSALTPAPHPTR